MSIDGDPFVEVMLGNVKYRFRGYRARCCVEGDERRSKGTGVR